MDIVLLLKETQIKTLENLKELNENQAPSKNAIEVFTRSTQTFLNMLKELVIVELEDRFHGSERLVQKLDEKIITASATLNSLTLSGGSEQFSRVFEALRSFFQFNEEDLFLKIRQHISTPEREDLAQLWNDSEADYKQPISKENLVKPLIKEAKKSAAGKPSAAPTVKTKEVKKKRA